MTSISPLGARYVHGLRNRIARRPILAALLALGVAGGALFVADSAKAGEGQEGKGQQKVTICHLADEGQPIEIKIGAPGAANHLENHTDDSPGECDNNCSFGGQCDDGNECTQDACRGDNTCDFEPVVCPDDGNVCTSYDPCDPNDGCVINTVAQEGNPCLFGELPGVCKAGECEPETLPVVPCSEQGINQAIAVGGGEFACDVPTTVVTTAQIVIDDEVILDGRGNLIIEGDGAESVLVVSPNVKAKLRGVKVTGGGGVDFGGGIYNEGTLTLTNSIVSGNVARIAGGGIYSTGMLSLHLEDGAIVTGNVAPYGGGIYNLGTATVSDCTVMGNFATSGGGGIYNDGTLMLNNCTVSENSAPYGGGVWNNGTLVMNNGVVADNVAEWGAAGIVAYQGTVTLNSTVVTGNVAGDPTIGATGGGVLVMPAGTATLSSSSVSENTANSGGGIYSKGTVTLTSATIDGNHAWTDGGGISNWAALTLINSTVSGNQADEGEGGGIRNSGSLVVVNVTLVANHGAAIHNAYWTADYPGTATVKNTLVVPLSESVLACVNEGGALLTSGGHNLEGLGDTCGFSEATDRPNATHTQLSLGPLQDNGGGPLTHMLLQGSIAIDAIPEPECVVLDDIPLLNDQRGVHRPQGAQCDIGAVEVESTFACTEQGIREAIAVGGLHTFDCIGPTTVTTAAEIIINKDAILDGGGNLTVDADNGHRVFSVSLGVTAELRGFTVSNGYAEWGAGIHNQGTLILTTSAVTGNTAYGEGYYYGGGGIKNEGTLTLTESNVTGNTSASFGGGIYSWFWDGPTTLKVRDSEVSDNTALGGGGIWSAEGKATLRRSIVSHNTAVVGGGILTQLGTLKLISSQVSSNRADFTPCQQDPSQCGDLPLAAGGGILNDRSIVEALRTEVSWNSAGPIGAGGGFFNGSSNPNYLDAESRTIATNSTLSNNVAEGDGTVRDGIPSGTGGGSFSHGAGASSVSTHLTLADNIASHGGSAGFITGGTHSMGNSVIKGNCSGLAGTVVSEGYNIGSPGSTCGLNHPTDLIDVAPAVLNLDELQDNGGLTRTHALLDGSPAINRVPLAECVDAIGEPLRTDQRYVPRPAGESCDAGAYENECGGCDDENECTSNVCTNGICNYLPVPDGASCDNHEGTCESGVCEPVAPSCEDVDCGDDNECTSDVCTNGECSNPPVTDGTSCGNGDGSCQSGGCEPHIPVPLCTGVDCNDENSCTIDSCVPTTGQCINTAVDDFTYCADEGGWGVCEYGTCQPVIPHCGGGVFCWDDGDPCTVELCDYYVDECLHPAAPDGTSCGSSGETCQAGRCQRQDFDLDLAYRWAPIHYQDVDPDRLDGIADYITRVDYDYDWDTTNNWDNLDKPGADLSAHVYYSVAETSTHWFIIYAFYHPQDWYTTSLTHDPAEHENDMEGFLAFVRKDGTEFGQLEGIVTVAHTEFYSYLSEWGYFDQGIRAGEESLDGFVFMESFDGEDHPKTAQEAQGHGLKAWPEYPIEGATGVIYYPSRSVAEVPAGLGPNYRNTQYKLVDIFAPDGLWDHRYDGKTFFEWGAFAGNESGGCGYDFGDVTWCNENAAHAPWGWDDVGYCRDVLAGPLEHWVCIYEPDDLPAGLLATQPARLVDNYFNGLSPFEKTLYERNPYMSFVPVIKYEGKGYSSVLPYEVGGERYILFQDTSWPSTSVIQRVKPDGTLEHVWEFTWGSFTTLTSYRVGDKVFVLGLRRYDGYREIHEVNQDGTLGTVIEADDNWGDFRWIDAVPFYIGSTPFIMFLGQEPHKLSSWILVKRLNADGTLGATVSKDEFPGIWWYLVAFTGDGEDIYQFRYSWTPGLFQVVRMQPDGLSGEMVALGSTENFPGFTQGEVFYAEGRQHLLLTGNVVDWSAQIYRVGRGPATEGIPDKLVEQEEGAVWSSVKPYYDGRGQLYRIKHHSGSGETVIERYQQGAFE